MNRLRLIWMALWHPSALQTALVVCNAALNGESTLSIFIRGSDGTERDIEYHLARDSVQASTEAAAAATELAA